MKFNDLDLRYPFYRTRQPDVQLAVEHVDPIMNSDLQIATVE